VSGVVGSGCLILGEGNLVGVGRAVFVHLNRPQHLHFRFIFVPTLIIC